MVILYLIIYWSSLLIICIIIVSISYGLQLIIDRVSVHIFYFIVIRFFGVLSLYIVPFFDHMSIEVCLFQLYFILCVFFLFIVLLSMVVFNCHRCLFFSHFLVTLSSFHSLLRFFVSFQLYFFLSYFSSVIMFFLL